MVPKVWKQVEKQKGEAQKTRENDIGIQGAILEKQNYFRR